MPDGARIKREGTGWIGRSRLRVEDERLLTGRGRYVNDVSLPGCLYVAFVRSVHGAAALRRIGTDAAAAVPGVVAVFTGADVADLGAPAVNHLLPGLRVPPFQVLARDAVCAVGQPVAAVVAATPEAAADGAELVEIDYEPTEVTLTPVQTKGEAAVSHDWRSGDADAAFRTAARVVRVRVEHSRVAPMPLEPRAAAAYWDAGEERLTVWLSTQTPHRARQDLATILRIDAARIRVIAPDVGGAFGGKASIFPEDIFVAWASRRLGRPVRWRGSRGEDLLAGTHGRGGTLEGELAVSTDGKALALRARLSFPLGHWMPYSGVVPGWNAARILPGPYSIAAVDIHLDAFPDNTAAVGIYRGAGRPEAAMLLERLMDEAARELAIDPVELRRRNLLVGHAAPRVTPTGVALDSGNYGVVLEEAVELAGYAALRERQAARRANGGIFGVGVAMYVEPCGQGWESAVVRLARNGSIVAATGSTAQGQGRETAYAQIVADVLALPPDAVSVKHGDTDQTPAGIGALASRSTAIGGSALLRAAQELRTKACALAARLLQLRPEQIIVDEDGFALDTDPERRISWKLLADAAYAEDSEGLVSSVVFHADGEAWSSGCCIAAVSIDADTGVPTIEHLAWVDDAGVVVNPLLVEGQLLGGMAQGIGEALMERVVYDGDGQILTGSLMDYALPRAADMPPVLLRSLATPSPVNALGAKGVGEAGCIGVPAAIVNAVVDALAPFGVRHLDMPLTSEKIWRALRDAANREDAK